MTATDTGDKGLARSASRGAAVTFVGQGGRIAVQLVGIVVLARLLSPTDYGVLAMVLAITGVGEILRDFGLSSAAIQAKTVSTAQKSNLFWINLGIGVVLSLVVFGASWPIAAFYDDARLQPVAALLSVTFLLSGVTTQFRADLNRKLRFGRLTGVDLAGQIGGLGLAIAAALAGWGYWSLVVQQLAPGLIQLIVLLFVTGWFPGLPKRKAGMRGLLTFGSNLAAVQLLGYGSRNVDSIVIGATLGANAVGVYNRAFQLMLLPLNQINAPSTRVALPVLSRIQDDPPRFAEYLRVGQTFMLNVVSFVLALAAAQASSIIALALGPQWSASVVIFQILAVAGFFSAAGYACYWVFLAKGLTGSQLVFSLISRPIMIVIIALGSFWGVIGVAVAYALANALVWPAQLLWLRRTSDAPVRMMFFNGMRTVVIYPIVGITSFVSTMALPDDQYLLRIAVGLVVAIATIGLAALVFPPFRRDLSSIYRVRHYLAKRGRSTSKGKP